MMYYLLQQFILILFCIVYANGQVIIASNEDVM